MDIDVRALSESPSADLASAYILSFLVHHDWDDIAPALTESDKTVLAPDQPGTIDLTAAAHTFIIHLPTKTNHSTWTFVLPGSE